MYGKDDKLLSYHYQKAFSKVISRYNHGNWKRVYRKDLYGLIYFPKFQEFVVLYAVLGGILQGK